MKNENEAAKNPRRQFLGQIAAGATALSLTSVILPLNGCSQPAANNASSGTSEADKWFEKVKGKHRMVFDVTRPHEVFPFAWPKVFLLTNETTGSPGADCGVVVVLRHEAIGYAFDNSMWEKYKFGEVFKADDPKTKAPSLRNPFWKPQPDDFKIPGVGPVAIGINDLQASGVMFCVCDMAMTVYSAVVGGNTNAKPEDVKKDWTTALLPGVQVVPSGVWALGRAQEHGCAYCSAG